MNNDLKEPIKVLGKIHIIIYDKDGNKINEIIDENESTIYFDLFAGQFNLALRPIEIDIKRRFGDDVNSYLKMLFSQPVDNILSNRFNFNLNHNSQNKTYSINTSYTNNTGNRITIYGFGTHGNGFITTIYLLNQPLILEPNTIMSLSYIITYPRTGNTFSNISIRNININNFNQNSVIPFNVKSNPSYRLARYNRVIIKNILRYGFHPDYILGIQSQVNVNITSTHPEYKALKSFNEIIDDNNGNVLKDKLESQLVGEFFYWIRQSGGIGVAKARRFILINSGIYNYYSKTVAYYHNIYYNDNEFKRDGRDRFEKFYYLNTVFLNNKIKYYPINTNHYLTKRINLKYKSKQIKVKLFNLNFNNYNTINKNDIAVSHSILFNFDYNNYIYFKRINNNNSINIYGNNINQNNIYYEFNKNIHIHSRSSLENMNYVISILNQQYIINNARITFCFNSGKIIGVENIPLTTKVYTDRGEQMTIQEAIGKTLFGNILYFEYDIDENNPSYVIFETSSENNGVEEYELGYENIYLQLYGYNGIFFDKLRKRIYTTIFGETPHRIISYQYRIAYEYNQNTNKIIPILSEFVSYPTIDDIFYNISQSEINQIRQTLYFNHSKLVLVFLKHPITGEITYTLMSLKQMLDITGSTVNINGINYLIDWEIQPIENIDYLVIDFTGSVNFNQNEYITFQINDHDYLINTTTLETYNLRDGDTILTELAEEYFDNPSEENSYVRIENHSYSNRDNVALNPIIEKNKLLNNNLKYKDYLHEFNDNHFILTYLVQNPRWNRLRGDGGDWLTRFNINGRIILPIPKVIKKDNIEYIVDLRDIKITDGYSEVDWSLTNSYQYYRDTKNKDVGFSDLLSSIITQNYWLIEITNPTHYGTYYTFDFNQQSKIFYVFIRKKTLNDLLPLNLTLLNTVSETITNGIACIRLPFVLPNTIKITRTDTNVELNYSMIDETDFKNLKYSNVIYIKLNNISGSTFSTQNVYTYNFSETFNCGLINPRLINLYGDGYILTTNHRNKIISNNTQSLAITGNSSGNEQVITNFGSVSIKIENTNNVRSQNYRTFFDFIYEYGVDNINNKFTFITGNNNTLRFSSFGILGQVSNTFYLKGNITYNQPYFVVKIKGNNSGIFGTTNDTEGLIGRFYTNYWEYSSQSSDYTMYRIGNFTSNHTVFGNNNYITFNNYREYHQHASRNITNIQNNQFSFRFKNNDNDNLYGGNFIYFNKVLSYKLAPVMVKEIYENPYNYILTSFTTGYQNSSHNLSRSYLSEVSLLGLFDTDEINPKRKIFIYVPERYMNKSLSNFTNGFYIYDYNENKGLFNIISKQNVRVYTFFNDVDEIIQNSSFQNDLIKEFNYVNPFVMVRKINNLSNNVDFAQIVLGYPYEIIFNQQINNASPIINLKFLKDKLGGRFYRFKNTQGQDINFTSVPQNTLHATQSTQINENDEFILLHHQVFPTRTSYRSVNNNIDMRYTPFSSYFNFYAINRDNGRIYKFGLLNELNSGGYGSYTSYYYTRLHKIVSYKKSSEWLSTNNLYSSGLEQVIYGDKCIPFNVGFYSINAFNINNLNYPLPTPHIVNGILSTNIENQYVDYPHLKRYYLTKQNNPPQSSSIPSGTNGFLTNFFEIYWYRNTQVSNTPILFTNYVDLDKVNNIELIDPVFITNAYHGYDLNLYVFMRIFDRQTNEEKIYGVENNSQFNLIDITQQYNDAKNQTNIDNFDSLMSNIYGTLKTNTINLKPFWKWIKDNIPNNQRNRYRISFGVGFRYTLSRPIQMKLYGINLLIDLTDKNLYKNIKWNWFNTNTLNVSNMNDANTIIIEPIPSNYFIIEHDNNSNPDTSLIVNTSDIHDRTKPFRFLNLLSGMNIDYMTSYSLIVFTYL